MKRIYCCVFSAQAKLKKWSRECWSSALATKMYHPSILLNWRMFSGLDFDTENNTTLGRGVIFIIDCINFDSFRPPKFGALSRLTTIHINFVSILQLKVTLKVVSYTCMLFENGRPHIARLWFQYRTMHGRPESTRGPLLRSPKMSAHVHL